MNSNLLIAVITLNVAIFHLSFSQELRKDLIDSVYSMKPMIPPVSKSMLSDSITKEFKILGDINGDGKIDTVFLRPEHCPDEGEDGFSFVFSDTSIPRIRTCVDCRSLDWLFSAGDLDEDGKIELGQYSTACASRTKSLRVLKLVNSKWKTIGRVMYDVNFPEPIFSKRIKKLKRGVFTMREIWLDYKRNKVDREVKFEIH